jgi:hypothetical protein
MLAYLSAAWAGEADPIWPHLVLISLSIIAGFAVGAGIIYEQPAYPPSMHRVATRLVIGGIAVESLCTVSLFVFDERISFAQQSKIIELETQIAPRPFKKLQFDATQSVKGKISAVNIMSEESIEPNMFSTWITVALQKAGVKVGIYSAPPGAAMVGVMIAFPDGMEKVEELINDHLYIAFKNAGLMPAFGNLAGFLPFANIPRDVPLIFVGEKSLFGMQMPYAGDTAK